MSRLLFLIGVVVALAGGGVIVEAFLSSGTAGAGDGTAGGAFLGLFGLVVAWLNRPWAARRTGGGPGLDPHMWSDSVGWRGAGSGGDAEDNADSSFDNGDTGGDD